MWVERFAHGYATPPCHRRFLHRLANSASAHGCRPTPCAANAAQPHRTKPVPWLKPLSVQAIAALPRWPRPWLAGLGVRAIDQGKSPRSICRTTKTAAPVLVNRQSADHGLSRRAWLSTSLQGNKYPHAKPRCCESWCRYRWRLPLLKPTRSARVSVKPRPLPRQDPPPPHQ